MKKLISVILLIAGVVLFIYGNNVADTASSGEERISQAEESGQRRPTLGPIRRNVRAQEAEHKQQMLGEEEQKVAAFQVSADWLRGTGAVLFILGIGSLFFCCKRKA